MKSTNILQQKRIDQSLCTECRRSADIGEVQFHETSVSVLYAFSCDVISLIVVKTVCKILYFIVQTPKSYAQTGGRLLIPVQISLLAGGDPSQMVSPALVLGLLATP